MHGNSNRVPVHIHTYMAYKWVILAVETFCHKHTYKWMDVWMYLYCIITHNEEEDIQTYTHTHIHAQIDKYDYNRSGANV